MEQESGIGSRYFERLEYAAPSERRTQGRTSAGCPALARGIDSAAMSYLDPVDLAHPDFADFFDEVPLWSAAFGAAVLAAVPLRRGLTYLDIGSGTGFLSVELAQRAGSDAMVISVDPWAAAAARLGRKIAYLELRNVRVVEGDAADLDLPDASVDVGISNLGVNNFADPDRVMAVVARVLKPGATLLLTSNLLGHGREFYEIFERTLRDEGLEEALPRLARHVEHRATEASLTRLLAAHGFQIRRCTPWSFPMRYADGTALLNHHFIRMGFLPAWRAVLDGADAPRFFAVLERRLNEAARGLGELRLTVPALLVEATRRD